MTIDYIENNINNHNNHFTLCYIVLCLGNSVSLAVYAQSNLQTIKYRNLVIDLGKGIKTNA